MNAKMAIAVLKPKDDSSPSVKEVDMSGFDDDEEEVSCESLLEFQFLSLYFCFYGKFLI